MICGFDKDDVLHVITYGGKHCKIYSGIDSEPENTEIHRYNCMCNSTHVVAKWK